MGEVSLGEIRAAAARIAGAVAGAGGSEARFHALGKTSQGRLLHLSFTLRENGTLVRVISARDMHRKERLRYAQET